jgi:hypothetical protein
MRFKFARTAIASAAALAAAASQAATINLIDLGGVTGSASEQGFRIAANYWGNMFTNTATINLGVGYAPLASGIIGQTGSTQMDYTVAQWESRVNATKSLSTIDQTVVLPTLTGGGISGLTVGVNASGGNDTTVTATLNGTQTASKVLYLNTSVVKAIGGTAVYGAGVTTDAKVTFSSNFNFDFNPTDGITANTFDFIGVAIHEIGHALGFVSGVDFFDYFGKPNGPGSLTYDLNSTSIFSALDMFRYSAPGTLDFRTGGTKYFSINGGASALFGNKFATGAYNGDGNQASHWKDTPACAVGNGIMDPTFCFGQTGVVTGLDLAAFDAMGWNLSVNALTYANTSTADIYALAVPEPSAWAMMLVGGLGLAGVARRARRSTAGTPGLTGSQG